MLAKLCIVILTVTLTAASMLTVRQQRLDAVYDMRRSLESAAALDRQLQEVRIDIARRVTPGSVTQLASSLGPMEPIPAEWSDPLMVVLMASNREPSEGSQQTPPQFKPTANETETPETPAEDIAPRRNLGPMFDEPGASR